MLTFRRSLRIGAALAALCITVAFIRVVVTSPTETTLTGSWQGLLLPLGTPLFETMRSTVTFRPDGSLVMIVEKSFSTFTAAGKYSLKDGVLTLTFASGTTANARYKITRSDNALDLQSLDTPAAAVLTLQPLAEAYRPLLPLPPNVPLAQKT